MSIGDTPTYFEIAAGQSTYDSLRELWHWMNGSHPTTANAITYECLEAWDGTLREAPSAGLLSNLTAGHLWHPDAASSLPTGSWAVFRTQGGVVSAKCVFFVRMESSGQAGHSLISLDDWTVGGGSGASPTLPATIIGQPASGTGDGRFPSSTTMLWSVVMDEGCFFMKQFPASGRTGFRSTYMGEVDPATRESDDPRPFITPRSTAMSWSGGYTHVRLSPVDQVTLCQLENLPFYNITFNGTDYNDLGVRYVSNVQLDSSGPAGHRFTQGFFRNVGATSENATSNRATMGYDGTDYRFEVSGGSASYPQFVTRYPPGTALAGHTIIAEESVPTQLIPVVVVVPQTIALPPRALKSWRHLFPKSFQWNLTYAREFLQVVLGLTPALDAAADNLDTLFADIFPSKASLSGLTNWERQFALRATSALTTAERRTRLEGEWSSAGGQSAGYITRTLQSHGFPVYVHEWWDVDGNGYPVAKDPRDHLLPDYGGTDADGFLLVNNIRTAEEFDVMTAGESFAYAGEPQAVAGFFGGYQIGRVEYTYVGPETRHPFYLYIGGGTFPATVDIPADRREEFESLCQKLCPSQQWLVLRVRYI